MFIKITNSVNCKPIYVNTDYIIHVADLETIDRAEIMYGITGSVYRIIAKESVSDILSKIEGSLHQSE